MNKLINTLLIKLNLFLLWIYPPSKRRKTSLFIDQKREKLEKIQKTQISFVKKIYQKLKFSNIQIFSSKIINKIKMFIHQLNPTQLVASLLFCSLITLGIIDISYHSNKIINASTDENYSSRSPASIHPEVKVKKAYHYQKDKMVKIENIKVPVITKDINSISNITLDFNITSDNRFISLYLKNHREEVTDYIITKFRPVLSSFVIKSEGKEIIKEHIKYILNDFILSKGIEGSIENVQIEGIIGT